MNSVVSLYSQDVLYKIIMALKCTTLYELNAAENMIQQFNVPIHYLIHNLKKKLRTDIHTHKMSQEGFGAYHLLV